MSEKSVNNAVNSAEITRYSVWIREMYMLLECSNEATTRMKQRKLKTAASTSK